MQLTQGGDEQFGTFAARVQGKAGKCGFHITAKCDCGRTFQLDYTTETVKDVLLAGIADIDIRREALSTRDIQQKPINDIIRFVEGREMARNATPSASVSVVKAPPRVPTLIKFKSISCSKCSKSFHPVKENHKLCQDCWRSSKRRRPASQATGNDKHSEIGAVDHTAYVSQVSAIELQQCIITNKDLRKGFSNHPRVNFSLSAILPDGFETNPISVDGVADTGAQSNVWGLEDFRRSGLSQHLLQEVTLNFRSVNKSKLEIVGGPVSKVPF